MHATSFALYASSPILLGVNRPSSGVNQYGLRPTQSYHFAYPTLLVNYGKATTMERINQRRSERGSAGSSPSLDGMAMASEVPRMLGLSRNPSPGNLQFCSQETASLRICMAKGDSACDRENRALKACMARVMPLREALVNVGERYLDWHTQNVSDNYMKPFTTRQHDYRAYRSQHQIAIGAKPGQQRETIPWGLNRRRAPNSGKQRHARRQNMDGPEWAT